MHKEEEDEEEESVGRLSEEIGISCWFGLLYVLDDWWLWRKCYSVGKLFYVEI